MVEFGRHAGFRYQFLREWGFESLYGYQNINNNMKINDLVKDEAIEALSKI